jgi:hypothetical protein
VNWEAISAIGQIVGAIAVVVSLIYLAREIRRNARAARVTSLGTINQCLRELAEHPHLGDLYYRGVHGFESLKNGDLIRFGSLLLQLFYIYSEMYHQQLEGHLDPRLWRESKLSLCDIIAYPGIQAWWRLRSHWFSDEFVNFIDQVRQTAGFPRMYREPMGDE